MSLFKTIDQRFNDLRVILKNKSTESFRMDAQGGNTVIFTYPPKKEKEYLARVKKDYPNAYFIDIANLFIKFIDSIGFDDFIEAYNQYSSEPEKLFKSSSDPNDFYNLILSEIKNAIKNNKMAIIVRTGALYGTGIENISIMEENIVCQMDNPLIIMYPAEISDDNKLRFLNCRVASGYRAIII
jgi:hypothetical protein